MSDDLSESEQEARHSEQEQPTFAILYPVAHPFFESVTINAEQYARENGYQTVIRAPREPAVENQIRWMEHFIEMEVDGIAIGPSDANALTPFINKAMDAGIPVICFDTDAPDSKRISYIGTDNYNAGQHLGEVAAELIDYEGKVIGSTGLSSMLNLSTRVEGAKDVFAQYPGIELVEVRSSGGIAGNTTANIKQMTDEHPDFDVFVGFDSLSGPAAIMVWKAKGLDQPAVTFDDLPENLKGMENGQITRIISQRQFTWGELMIEHLNQALHHEDISEIVHTSTVEINRANLNQYNQP